MSKRGESPVNFALPARTKRDGAAHTDREGRSARGTATVQRPAARVKVLCRGTASFPADLVPAASHRRPGYISPVTRLLSLCAGILLSCAAQSPRPSVKLASLLGKPLDITALDLAGREVHVAAGQVVIVDFFASWCEPCKIQLPHLDGLAQRLGGRGLAVYGVSLDEDRAALEGFLALIPVGFKVLWDPGGERLAPSLGIERLPTTLVLGRSGAVRHVHLGYDARVGEQIEAEAMALLAEQ